MSKRKKQLNTFARFSGIAIQMGVTIYLGGLLGEWLDARYDNLDKLYTKICTLVAVFASIYSVIRQVTKFTEKNN